MIGAIFMTIRVSIERFYERAAARPCTSSRAYVSADNGGIMACGIMSQRVGMLANDENSNGRRFFAGRKIYGADCVVRGCEGRIRISI
jgi:hypothetical protein